jgi:uncharacterized small protein (DUF1192 family)
MHSASSSANARRSSRVQTAVPILVSSLDGTRFTQVCRTLVVNAHGCAILSRVRFDTGAPLHFRSKEGRQTTAHVVSCQAVDKDNHSWRLGARLDQPENFWGLQNCPTDWDLPSVSNVASLPPVPLRPNRMLTPASQSTPSAPAPIPAHIEAQMNKMVAESVRPLQAEIAALKQQLAQRDANRSRFEVSLSSIPPELEQQLELRLQKFLGPKMLDDTRQQSAHLLEAAKAAIDQKTTQGYEDFLLRSQDELKVMEKRAEDISAHISARAREQLSRGLDELQQHLLEGGNSLKRLSDELLKYLQYHLNEEHEARRGDLEQLRASAASQSSRLHEHVEYLDSRIAALNDSAQRLESGLDDRLSQLASSTVSDARNQLEALTNDVLEQSLKTSTTELSDQLEAASENLKMIQAGIVTYVSESLKAQSVEALQAFERSLEETATYCVERWRVRLADGLNAVAKSMSEQFRLEERSS